MSELNITWKDTIPGVESSPVRGTDKDGNVYYAPANREIVSVVTPDGREGSGWTPEEALTSAEKVGNNKEVLSTALTFVQIFEKNARTEVYNLVQTRKEANNLVDARDAALIRHGFNLVDAAVLIRHALVREVERIKQEQEEAEITE